MDTQWFIHPPDFEGRRRLSAALEIHPITSQILLNRKIATVYDAKRFLNPNLSELPDPFCLPDMDKAVDRIVAALKAKERIALYGDYDVDGITGVALLTRFLRSIGHEPLVFIPCRLTEGYGLNTSAIDRLKTLGASLIITVDCGTRSLPEIEYAHKHGIDIIVTDHHEVLDIPDHILLNPKRPDIDLPEKEMAGCAVAFLLLMALRKRLRGEKLLHLNEPNLKEHLDLVALGTIADVIPLTGVNRIFAKHGLEIARNSMKPGMRSLIGVCGLEGVPLKTGNVAFRLAPRINAAGRMGDALPSLELLTTDDIHYAHEIARALDTLNSDRQRIEERILQEAIELIECEELHKRAAIVVAQENWHAGIIGIVASKLVERYALPAVVIAAEGKKAKGSARSVSGLNIVEALGKCSHLLDRFGGHAQAAGLQVETTRIDSFRKIFEACCAEIAPPQRAPRVTIDALAEHKDITIKLAREIELFEPFGLGNPEPILCANNLRVVNFRIVGKNHLKMSLAGDNNLYFDTIGFGLGETTLQVGQNVSIAFTPQINSWNGLESLQLKIREISFNVIVSPSAHLSSS